MLSMCVCLYFFCSCGTQEKTMGRRPTIQTTVTASLTKSSLGACNQMLPVKFASKFVCPWVISKFGDTEERSHCGYVLFIHLNGATHNHLLLFRPFTPTHLSPGHLPLSSNAVVVSHSWADQYGHHLSSWSGLTTACVLSAALI